MVIGTLAIVIYLQFGACNLLFLFILLKEFLNPAGGINEFLLAREKRMTLRTYLHAYILPRRTGMYDLAARADNSRLLVIRVNFFFHDKPPRISE